jgi:uncharacterized membrane protein YfcA
MTRNPLAVFGGGAAIGALGGLIGLGGAEFRLPLLISTFRFGALEAVILNTALSLVVVAAALRFRTGAVPVASVLTRWDVMANLLAGSLAGAWVGAAWATRLRSHTLYRVIALLLVAIAAVLLLGPEAHDAGPAMRLAPVARLVTGLAAGFAIGVVAALLGVAGAELLIPTVILLFGADIKLAGSLALAVSRPTMLVGSTRYSQDRSFSVLGRHRGFVVVMAAGSLGGAIMGGRLVGQVPNGVLLPLLALLLVVSAVKVWRHAG